MTDLIGSITAARDAAPDASTFDLLRRSAKSMRQDASIMEGIAGSRGDEGGRLAAHARSRRELADACDRRAGEIGPPSKALAAWERGQREAMIGWKPAGWRDVPVLGANKKKE